MIWTGLACLNQFIKSVVWTGNVINWAPVWCDISTRFMIGFAVAIPCASLCINRRLYYITTADAVTATEADKRRAVMVDLAIGIGIPVLEMVLQYIDQGHRFDIFEDIGCYFFTYNTWVAYVLVATWPLAIGCISATYSILTIRAFMKRRSQFKEILFANSKLNFNLYFRLMCLAGTEIVFTVPLSCWSIYLNITSQPIEPWNGWTDFPSVIWHLNEGTAISLETSRWFVVVCAIVFFGFFGFADEARKNYRACKDKIALYLDLACLRTTR
ncbi:pheromone receptor [Gymnopus androsaceus JB14]|uniref:Pheromone receptor n=1 Tax=Gymnopus androsaceus JB14 TaxID=1447944 RepID=A0A6A4GXP0_9AGAR|nr:pheromone receptor [Gymnopus androsaceus JB14]